LKRGGRSYCAEETVTGVVNARKKRTDRWDRFVSGEIEERQYRFGEKTSWAMGRFPVWADSDPRGPFPFLFSFLLFFF
jgi:hypothetical protein